jgi:hypothetical protein
MLHVVQAVAGGIQRGHHGGVKRHITFSNLHQQVFQQMGQLGDFVEAKKPSTAFDGVNGAKQQVDEIDAVGLLKFTQTLLELGQALGHFDQEIFKHFIFVRHETVQTSSIGFFVIADPTSFSGCV